MLITKQRSHWLVSSLEWGCSFNFIWYWHPRYPPKRKALKQQSRTRGWRLQINEVSRWNKWNSKKIEIINEKVKCVWTEPKCDVLHTEILREIPWIAVTWAEREWTREVPKSLSLLIEATLIDFLSVHSKMDRDKISSLRRKYGSPGEKRPEIKIKIEIFLVYLDVWTNLIFTKLAQIGTQTASIDVT